MADAKKQAHERLAYACGLINPEYLHLSLKHNPIISAGMDGTTKDCEIYNIVFRFILDNKIQQRVVNLELLEYGASGAGLAATLINQMNKYNIDYRLRELVSIVRDRASVNDAV